jgi:hypothetical protein
MTNLANVLSEGKKYDFNGNYLIQRSPADFGRHNYTFSGNLMCLSEQRVIGHMSYSLSPEKSHLILGLLNDDELLFSEMSTYDRMLYSLRLTNPFRLKLEGECKVISDLQNFSEMLVNFPEINSSFVHDVKNFNYDLLSKISRERLLPYFQKGQLDKFTGRRTNFASIHLREI